ncbi:bis(5'-nucleosyl)-tetraphosphatase PrpE [Planomicrobium sp. CPCC 101110]|uniref:bis(5'-nucleosyl)-tetraphosphatase PrpE n=1 Tax=Planomicrobium sp. CPCC 101110 TaxID=2599619 RepID=UPI0011B7A89E|nr:bis(5'-nucleosyl)-tetraphosphatase PrpE [Planomicrobium sp. CPCC 101110]TWT27996.1 bis(5'-nucleosyl)-tetraphosphatase PrpE [Planomicrobium sp. CPCC 101110]
MKYDIIGDIHGCYAELLELFSMLGYEKRQGRYVHPKGRQLVFVGDAMDRGPDSLAVLRLLFEMQEDRTLYYCPGNHCNKLYRFFKGNRVQLTHGLETTVNEWHRLPKKEQQQFRSRYLRFYEDLPLYLELEGGLVVAHAGIKADMLGKPLSKSIAAFVLYGDTTGKIDAYGRPVRRDWAKSYKAEKWVVYGHTPTEEPYIINNTANIDTGCVFGGCLTAFRYPEKTTVSVPSFQPYQPERFHKFI